MVFSDEERPLAIQIYGSDAATMAEAVATAARLARTGDAVVPDRGVTAVPVAGPGLRRRPGAVLRRRDLALPGRPVDPVRGLRSYFHDDPLDDRTSSRRRSSHICTALVGW